MSKYEQVTSKYNYTWLISREFRKVFSVSLWLSAISYARRKRTTKSCNEKVSFDKFALSWLLVLSRKRVAQHYGVLYAKPIFLQECNLFILVFIHWLHNFIDWTSQADKIKNVVLRLIFRITT